MVSDPEVKIVLTIDGKEYTAGLKDAAKEMDNFGGEAKGTSKDVESLSARVKKAEKQTNEFGGQTKNTAKDVKNLSAQVKKAEKQTDNFGNQTKDTAKDIKNLSSQVKKAKKQTNNFGSEAGDATADTNHLKGAVKLLAGAFAAIKIAQTIVDLKDTALQAEALANKLRFAVGGSEEAAEAMDFVRNESNRLGLELLSQADAYGSIAAASKGTRLEGAATKEIYLGVAEATAALSLTTDQSTGAMRALEQMMSKGTVQAEELRGQLGERIPGAFQIAARSMGVTTAELGKMLERGEVMSDVFLPKFAAELRKTFGEDAAKNATSARASFNKLNTALFELKSTLGAGLNESLSGTADWLTTIINKVNVLTGSGRSIEAIQSDINALEARIDRTTSRRGRKGGLTLRLAELQAEVFEARLGSSNPTQIKSALNELDTQINATQTRINAIPEDQRTQSVGTGRSKRASKFGLENKELQRLINERKTLNQRLANLENKKQQDAASGTSGATASATTTAAGNSLEQNLQRQTDLYGQVGNAAKVRYETERGALAGLEPAQKEKLIDMADELDFIKANDEAVREAIATQNEAVEADRQLAAAKRQMITDNLSAIELSQRTEAESENQRYQLALEQLQAAEDAKLNTLVGYDELRERLKIEHEGRLTQIETGASGQRLQIQQRVEAQVVQMRAATVNSAVALLSALGARSKKFAAVAILLEKATAIQRVLIQSKVAAMAALTPPPIGLGPVAGAGLAASITSAGYASAGFITGLGAIQLSGLNSNNGAGVSPVYSADPSTGLPTANANPYAPSASSSTSNNSGGTTVIEVAGRDTDTITLTQMEQIWKMQADAIERGDRILFRRNSAQGLELTEAAA